MIAGIAGVLGASQELDRPGIPRGRPGPDCQVPCIERTTETVQGCGHGRAGRGEVCLRS